jgi:hypothetical protein
MSESTADANANAGATNASNSDITSSAATSGSSSATGADTTTTAPSSAAPSNAALLLDELKAAYPAQYYGLCDASASGVSSLITAVDAWAVNGVYAGANLPAAAAMIALTAGQYALAQGASSIPVQGGALLYPARYYAGYDTTAAQPTHVTGWFDSWDMTSLAAVPAATAMVALSPAQWADPALRMASGKGVQGGAIVDCIQTDTLPVQAQAALNAARAYVQNTYLILNEATPDAWVAYIKALMAIANGTDTAATALPVQPAP